MTKHHVYVEPPGRHKSQFGQPTEHDNGYVAALRDVQEIIRGIYKGHGANSQIALQHIAQEIESLIRVKGNKDAKPAPALG